MRIQYYNRIAYATSRHPKDRVNKHTDTHRLMDVYENSIFLPIYVDKNLSKHIMLINSTSENLAQIILQNPFYGKQIS